MGLVLKQSDPDVFQYCTCYDNHSCQDNAQIQVVIRRLLHGGGLDEIGKVRLVRLWLGLVKIYLFASVSFQQL